MNFKSLTVIVNGAKGRDHNVVVYRVGLNAGLFLCCFAGTVQAIAI